MSFRGIKDLFSILDQGRSFFANQFVFDSFFNGKSSELKLVLPSPYFLGSMLRCMIESIWLPETINKNPISRNGISAIIEKDLFIQPKTELVSRLSDSLSAIKPNFKRVVSNTDEHYSQRQSVKASCDAGLKLF